MAAGPSLIGDMSRKTVVAGSMWTSFTLCCDGARPRETVARRFRTFARQTAPGRGWSTPETEWPRPGKASPRAIVRWCSWWWAPSVRRPMNPQPTQAHHSPRVPNVPRGDRQPHAARNRLGPRRELWHLIQLHRMRDDHCPDCRLRHVPASASSLYPRLLKVLSNLRRDLAICHLVDGVNPHDAFAEPFTLKMVFEFDLGLTRA